MSSGHQQHLTSTDIDMLNRILSRAGIDDLSDSAGTEKRLTAARFLIDTFQHGITDEGALYFALRNKPEDLPEQDPPFRGAYPLDPPTVARERPQPAPHTKGGYRFGRRVERNGTWTIYHVFNGEPAAYGSGNMVGLSVRTADRALRLLNAPLASA